MRRMRIGLVYVKRHERLPFDASCARIDSDRGCGMRCGCTPSCLFQIISRQHTQPAAQRALMTVVHETEHGIGGDRCRRLAGGHAAHGDSTRGDRVHRLFPGTREALLDERCVQADSYIQKKWDNQMKTQRP